jgi:hypothetical protein
MAGFSENEHESGTAKYVVATAVEEDNAVPAEGLDASLSVLDLVPAAPESSSPRFINSLASSPTIAQSDCAAELVATMGRLLATSTSASGAERETSKVACEQLQALMFGRPVARLGQVDSKATWSSVSGLVLRTKRGAMATAGPVLRQWRLGFRHDWNAMVKAMDFPQMRTSLIQWLLRPFSSKPMTSSKNQTV